MGVYNITLSDKEVATTKEAIDNQNNNESTKVVEIPQDKAKEKTEEKTVVLDGPLSHIYTQALNMVYANEAVNMITQMAVDSEEKYGEDKPSNDNKDLYVYCCDGDKLDSDGLVEATNKLRLALDVRHHKNIIVSVESVNPNNKVALLDEFSSSLGINVIYSRNKTIDNIRSIVKK